ncbi:MAG: RNA exonuclease 3 [Pycnora praestabilis]|nr:MAG: RNA exonuclease 3 [Pycnora praestabilis]
MFSSTSLFKHLACPVEEHCRLPNCIFSHSPRRSIIEDSHAKGPPEARKEVTELPLEENFDGPRKRRRIGNGLDETSILNGIKIPVPNGAKPHAAKDTPKQIGSAQKTVSPPPLRKRPVTTPASQPGTGTGTGTSTGKFSLSSHVTKKKTLSKPGAEEALNPRMLPQPPASHAVRLAILTKLHEQLVRLNDDIVNNKDTSSEAFALSPQGVIKMALDEEEKAARESPSVYSNVIKLRIMAFKRMKLDEWKELRAEAIALSSVADGLPELPKVKPPPPLETGLEPSEELALLPRLVAHQEGLQKFGYVISPPSESEILAAKKGVEAAQGWEQCDRCKSRFQVFPGRREGDGALTTGGRCIYHYGRSVRPQKQRTDAITGHVESSYSCCNQAVGSSMGCTTAETHVFKVSEPKRLASILQFERTPETLDLKTENAVCFDCEMGYTVYGMELIRLTATAWPSGDELLDVLVRPLGEILDLNSRFSGVWPQDITDAIPFTSDNGALDAPTGLKIVPSPSHARSLLFAYLTPTTPLIGHAIDNDLNASRMVHPTIIDTVLLYPHPRGLPMRLGLKNLTLKHLERHIQTGGAMGHDSKEDARAAGDLVRVRIGDVWKGLKREGWAIREGVSCPPKLLEERAEERHAVRA